MKLYEASGWVLRPRPQNFRRLFDESLAAKRALLSALSPGPGSGGWKADNSYGPNGPYDVDGSPYTYLTVRTKGHLEGCMVYIPYWGCNMGHGVWPVLYVSFGPEG